jgi:hypothetical protein
MQAEGNNFIALRERLAQRLASDHGLIVKTGHHLNSEVIKLLRPHWSLDDSSKIENYTGIFFSLWIEDEEKKRNVVMYNIHAKKLVRLGDHKIKARQFAEHFRKRAKNLLVDWPNISCDHGPLTLFQGYFPMSPVTFEQDCTTRINAFTKLIPLIDELLQPHLAN